MLVMGEGRSGSRRCRCRCGHERVRAESRVVGCTAGGVVLMLGRDLDWCLVMRGCVCTLLGMGFLLGDGCGEVWDRRIATMLDA